MNFINGQCADAVPADDRGIAYGDGVFETLRVRKGALPLLDYHLERLSAGLRVLGFPSLQEPILRQELQTAARENPEGIIKLIVTRGSGARGYRVPEDCEPRRIISTAPVSIDLNAWRQGVTLRFCTTTLEGPRALDGLKHLNRLGQVLARAEWSNPDIHEGLMRDNAGRVVEGTMSNFFVVRNGELITPPVGAGVLGVMRRLVIERAAGRHIANRERFLADAEIDTADEVFITNSVIGICPVTRIGKRSFGIGTMTRMLQKEIDNELERRICSDD